MVEISVQNNPILHLQGFAFAGIRNVTNIYLGYNRLKQIDGYVNRRARICSKLVRRQESIAVNSEDDSAGGKSLIFAEAEKQS